MLKNAGHQEYDDSTHKASLSRLLYAPHDPRRCPSSTQLTIPHHAADNPAPRGDHPAPRPPQPNTAHKASHPLVLVPESLREFCRCHVLRPLLRQLRGGVTPRRLAWSIALGVVIGINPSVGLTTLLVILLAWTFGLNQVASQIGAHAMTPFHLLLFLPFIQLGVHLFHTRQLPMNRKQIEHLSHHPVRLLRDIWQWEWHALIVWGILAAILMPLLAINIRRALVLLMRRHSALVRSRPAPQAAK